MNKRKAQKVGLKKGESEIRSICSVIIKREGEKERKKDESYITKCIFFLSSMLDRQLVLVNYLADVHESSPKIPTVYLE